jgi:hypothetical protein
LKTEKATKAKQAKSTRHKEDKKLTFGGTKVREGESQIINKERMSSIDRKKNSKYTEAKTIFFTNTNKHK